MECQKINNSKVAITLMLFSTAIQAVAGYARDASMTFKVILSLLCWISVFLSIKQNVCFILLVWFLGCTIIGGLFIYVTILLLVISVLKWYYYYVII